MNDNTIKDVLAGNASIKMEHEITVSRVVIYIAIAYAFIVFVRFLVGGSKGG